MPGWSEKRDRQYEKIKASAQERGTPEKRAKEIAARTVNKQRREHGETPSRRTQGTGNPNTSLEDRTRAELANRAKELGVEGYSNMRKRELVAAIREKQ